MFATDGILTREKLTPPVPIETGTADIYICETHKKICSECPPHEQTQKALGGWEYKPMPRGVFLARPGVYFPLEPTEKDLKTLRARGIGRRTMLDHYPRIQAAWEDRKKDTWPTVTLDKISRFCGAKTSTSRVLRKGEWVYRVARGKHIPTKKGETAQPRYGEWIERKVEMSFDPLPKRIGRPDGTLEVRSLPEDLMSAPYDRAVLSDEAKELIAMAEMLAEQPHADFEEYSDG